MFLGPSLAAESTAFLRSDLGMRLMHGLSYSTTIACRGSLSLLWVSTLGALRSVGRHLWGSERLVN